MTAQPPLRLISAQTLRWVASLPVALSISACSPEPPPPDPAPRPAPVSSGGIAFEDVTSRAGIDKEGNSWTIAWGDANGDGFPEFLSTNHGDPTQLYWNNGDGTFQLDDKNRFLGGDMHGAAWADFDQDGDQDLVELSGAQRGMGVGASHLYVNTNGRLAERAKELGLDAPTSRARLPLWLDWDRDGQLDVLFTCAKREGGASQMFLQREGHFIEAADLFLGKEQSMFANVTSLGTPPRPHLILHGFSYPQLVLELSAEGATDVTESVGVPQLAAVEDVAIGDFDGDGSMDFYLARGTLGPQILQIDESHVVAKIIVQTEVRGLSFTCRGALTIGAHPIMSDWWMAPNLFLGAEKRNPEELPFTITADQACGEWKQALTEGEKKGFFVLADPDSGIWTLVLHGDRYEQGTLDIVSDGSPITNVEAIGFEMTPHTPPDALLLRQSQGHENVAEAAGILPNNSLGVTAADLDNDMDLDLFVLCARSLQNEPNVLYENVGHGRFLPVEGAAGAAGTSVGVADAVAVADYDCDGFLDLLVSNGREIGPQTQGPLQLFRNKGNDNHWLRLRLKGQSDPEPVGARVLLEAGGIRQVRTYGHHMHRGAQDETLLHFGLGPNQRASRIEVLWPSGATQILEDVPADQVLDIQE